MKNDPVFQNMKSLLRREALFSIFADPTTNVWLGGRAQKSQTCSFVQCVVRSHVRWPARSTAHLGKTEHGEG